MAQFAAGEVLTAANLNAAINGRTLNSQSASAYTLALSDAGKIILASASVEQTITIPAASSVPFSAGVSVNVFANDNAAVNVVGAAGVTIVSGNASGSAVVVTGAYGAVELVNIGTDKWLAVSTGAGGGEGLSPLLLIGA